MFTRAAVFSALLVVLFAAPHPGDGGHDDPHHGDHPPPPHHPTRRPPPHHPTHGPPPHHPTHGPPPHHPTHGPPPVPWCRQKEFDQCQHKFEEDIDFNITANSTAFVEHLLDLTADKDGLTETCQSVNSFIKCASLFQYDVCTEPHHLSQAVGHHDAAVFAATAERLKRVCDEKFFEYILDSYDCIKENVTEDDIKDRCGPHHCHHTTTAAPEATTTMGVEEIGPEVLGIELDDLLLGDHMLIAQHHHDQHPHPPPHHYPCREIQHHISCVPFLIGKQCGRRIGGRYCNINRLVAYKVLGPSLHMCHLWCPMEPRPIALTRRPHEE